MTPLELGTGICIGLVLTFIICGILDAIYDLITATVKEWRHRRWLRAERMLRTTREEDHD